MTYYIKGTITVSITDLLSNFETEALQSFLICFISRLDPCYWKLDSCLSIKILNIQICKYLCLNSTNLSNFQTLEVVGRVSETQLQVLIN